MFLGFVPTETYVSVGSCIHPPHPQIHFKNFLKRIPVFSYIYQADVEKLTRLELNFYINLNASLCSISTSCLLCMLSVYTVSALEHKLLCLHTCMLPSGHNVGAIKLKTNNDTSKVANKKSSFTQRYHNVVF